MTAFSKGPIRKYEKLVQYVSYVSGHVARSLRFLAKPRIIMYSTMARLCREVDSKATKAVVVETCEWNKILIDSGFLFLISLLTQLKLTDWGRWLRRLMFKYAMPLRIVVDLFVLLLSKNHILRVLLFVQSRHYNITIHTTLWSTSWEVVSDHILWTKRQLKISLTVLESPWPREQDCWIVSTPPCWWTSCSQAERMTWTYVSVGNTYY